MPACTEPVEEAHPGAAEAGLAVWGPLLRPGVVVPLIPLIQITPAASPLVDRGPTVSAMASELDPALTPAQNATVKAVAADPTIVPKVQALAAQYKAELGTAALLKPETQAALAVTPNDPATQAEALAEISGLSAADIAKVITLGTQDKDQLATVAAIDPATQIALATHPTDAALQAKAVGEIAAGLGVPAADAIAKLQALGQVPVDDLVFLTTNGKPVQA